MDDGESKAGELDKGMEADRDKQGQRVTDLLKSLVLLPQLLLLVRWRPLQLLSASASSSPAPAGAQPCARAGFPWFQWATPPSHPAGNRPIPMPTCCGCRVAPSAGRSGYRTPIFSLASS